MNYDNKHTDKKLQELEHQSLPDLSKMDENWQQMGLLLHPGATSLTSGKTIFRKKFVLITTAIAVIAVVSFFVYQFANSKKSFRESDIAINNAISTIDSPVLLKVRTTEGKDTTLQAISVNEDKEPVNNKLLLEKFYEQLQKKPQRFLINNQRDTVINGKEGTRLFIPANSLDTKEDVTLLLTEFYSVSDMITNKLTTTCDRRQDGYQLVTGGMIYLDARTKNDELVDLKNGASLSLDMPKQDNQQPMELFYGFDHYRNDLTSVMDSIKWKRANQPFTSAPNKFNVSFQESNSTRKTAKRDTVWFEGAKPTLDYFLRDTVGGQSAPKIKGDSIVLQRFGVDIKQLGWINCDRFYFDSRPKIELIVDLGDKSTNYNTVLVFDKFTSILPPSSLQDKIVRFSNLPEGEPVRIISVGIKNGKTVTAMQPMVVSKNPVINMNFDEVTPLAFKNKLN